MTNTFNFQDGNGPVPAHRHKNGGGWVADAARVAESAYIGPDAVVSGNAVIRDNARVSGSARVNRGEYAETPVTITRSDGYTFTLQADGGVIAGCRDFTREQAFAHWGDPRHHKHAESMAILASLYAVADARK